MLTLSRRHSHHTIRCLSLYTCHAFISLHRPHFLSPPPWYHYRKFYNYVDTSDAMTHDIIGLAYTLISLWIELVVLMPGHCSRHNAHAIRADGARFHDDISSILCMAFDGKYRTEMVERCAQNAHSSTHIQPHDTLGFVTSAIWKKYCRQFASTTTWYDIIDIS